MLSPIRASAWITRSGSESRGVRVDTSASKASSMNFRNTFALSTIT
ncbi:hypothetical protein [Nocardiopsis composta]|uniref:Uncharacterized protein n=1 Tax=Nocardiopsis composta TaxID=157465 RepID=A0A7W8QHZ9_9ACTN|nr:hypothetical protein [Nocardiopsis composta]MBB5430711.1 hypothetical protein [Nocardiopsis composta]